jgi:hypothetical protein
LRGVGGDLTFVRRELADANTSRQAAEEGAAVMEAERAALRELVDRMGKVAREAEQAMQAALLKLSSDQQEHAAALASAHALAENANQWRRYGLDRQQRVLQLEAYVHQLRGNANAAAGAAFGTALLGVALGAAIATS